MVFFGCGGPFVFPCGNAVFARGDHKVSFCSSPFFLFFSFLFPPHIFLLSVGTKTARVTKSSQEKYNSTPETDKYTLLLKLQRVILSFIFYFRSFSRQHIFATRFPSVAFGYLITFFRREEEALLPPPLFPLLL